MPILFSSPYSIYQHYFKDEKVVDITVEDPSEDFVRLRDFVDTKNCLKSVESFGSFEAVSGGFTDAMALGKSSF